MTGRGMSASSAPIVINAPHNGREHTRQVECPAMRSVSCLFLLSLAGVLAGCPSPRTTAATRPQPVAFNPANSEPAAIEQVDASLAALGGGEKWGQVKELRFDVLYTFNNAPAARYQHAWDRWNGRHAMRTADMRTSGNREEDIKWHDVRYDIFNKDAVYWAAYAKQEALPADYAKAADLARPRLAEDSYRLALVYKLRDPGVRLQVAGAAAPTAGVCEPSCNSVKVTFDPDTGTDSWVIHFNKNTNLPEIMQQDTAKGPLIYKIVGWLDAGGMKWPQQLVNIGMAGETFEYSNIAIGEPRDADYGRDF
jgi:hypothetical protein